MPSPEQMGGVGHWPASVMAGRARIRYRAGDGAGARRELAAWHEEMERLPRERVDQVAAQYHHLQADEALPALAQETDVRAAYERYAGWPTVRYEPTTGRSVDRFTGMLALRLGFFEAAERHFQAGLDWAGRERCQVEQGRCLQGLAEVATRRGRHDEALPLLDRAAALFEQYEALLYLRQVQAARGLLPG